MSEFGNLPEVDLDTLAVDEMFGVDAAVLRERIESGCPDLALEFGLDKAILGFVPAFFYDDRDDLELDQADKANIVVCEINRYIETMDSAMSKFDKPKEE